MTSDSTMTSARPPCGSFKSASRTWRTCSRHVEGGVHEAPTPQARIAAHAVQRATVGAVACVKRAGAHEDEARTEVRGRQDGAGTGEDDAMGGSDSARYSVDGVRILVVGGEGSMKRCLEQVAAFNRMVGTPKGDVAKPDATVDVALRV